MSHEKTEPRVIHGILLILLAILCLSILPPLVRVGLTEAVGPVPLLAIRLVIATAFLGMVFGLMRPQVFRIDRAGLVACLLVGFSDTVASLCYYNAFTHVSTSVAHVIFSAYPVLALVLLSFRGERFSLLQIFGLCFALAGVFLLIGPGGEVNPVGTLLALGAGLGYATTLALTQWLLNGYDARTVTFYVSSAMTILTAAYWGLQWDGIPRISPTGWSVILITAVVSTALARLLLFAGIRRAGSGTVALLAPVETLLAVSWAVVFLGDRLSSIQWVGGALVVISMNLVMRRKSGAASPLRRLMGRWKSVFTEWI
ncbi:MAG: DMT family transporter [Xanthomonadales bacterium]|jgi:drug/metabolite transporter (DMT)-like permease|nr:DMT family transporter [Xanthomonadales bacterium]